MICIGEFPCSTEFSNVQISYPQNLFCLEKNPSLFERKRISKIQNNKIFEIFFSKKIFFFEKYFFEEKGFLKSFLSQNLSQKTKFYSHLHTGADSSGRPHPVPAPAPKPVRS